MKLALIPPHQLLDHTRFSTYQLALAHLFEDKSQYTKTYWNLCQDDNQHVILDNGAFEGSQVTAMELIKIANHFGVSEVVIPDCIGSKDLTIAMAKQFKEMAYKTLNPDILFMFVAQGNNDFEIRQSIRWAMSEHWIDTIALPKHLVETTGNKSIRLQLALHITENSMKQVHLLGGSPLWIEEVQSASELEFIRGMDTSMPYVYGMSEAHLEHATAIIGRPGDYFDHKLDSMQEHISLHNVKWMLNNVNEV